MTTTITPAEIDTRIGQLSLDAQRASYAIKRAVDTIHHAAGDTRSVRGGWKMIDDAARITLPPEALLRLMQDEAKARAEHAHIIGQIQALDAIWRQHFWTRYYFCTNTNGHIHTSERGCSTVQPTTGMSFQPQLSGRTPSQVVAEHGPALCSVCYPDAPVGHTSSNLTAIERERTRPERDARKAEIATARALKNLTGAEQFRTRYNGDRVETVAACKALIRKAIETQVEAEWTSTDEYAKVYTDQEMAARHRANIASNLEQEVADAGQAASILMEREQRNPGSGASMDEIAKIRTNAERNARKARGL